MKVRTTSRALIAGLAIAGALTMTACSSDDSSSSSSSSSSAASTSASEHASDHASSSTTASGSSAASGTAQGDLPPVPTVQDLNTELQQALDPAVPIDQKKDYIQGTEADPELVNRLADVYKQTGAQIEITGVQNLGDTLQATGNFTANGQTNPGTVPFVAEDGKWKIEKGWACNALSVANIQSPACA